MAGYETKELTGALFKNKRKESKNHPDSTGKCKIGGVEYWVSGWTKIASSGEKYVSLSFREVEERKGQAAPRRFVDEDLDDSIPF